MHDVKLTFKCPNEWMAEMSANPTNVTQILDVDPNNNCSAIIGGVPDRELTSAAFKKFNVSGGFEKLKKSDPEGYKKYKKWEDQEYMHENSQIWQRVKFTLFSMMVSASFFASYNPTTFYAGVVYLASTTLRPVFLYNTWRGYLYELVSPDPIIKVIECCYMKRHEEDLVGEEETYRMLQEIIRSPELIKALSGSCLKGSCDPLLD